MSHPIKKCLLIRAMLPVQFPKAYEQLRIKLKEAADLGGARFEPCNCKPVKCGLIPPKMLSKGTHGIPQPTKQQVEVLIAHIQHEPEAVRNEFLRLCRVPLDTL